VALFSLGLPNLMPPHLSRKILTVSFTPLVLLVSAGLLGFVRGQVHGSWLSIWLWLGLLSAVVLLYGAPRPGRRASARVKRGKR
jgi:hypothetical protein